MVKFHRNGGESSERSLHDKNWQQPLVFGVTMKHPPLCIRAKLGEMLNLKQNYSYTYREFAAGNFCVQLSPNSFSRVEADKVIETTVNWDTKTSGGLKGFSTKSIKVNRWMLNATHGASMRQCFYEMLNHRKSNSNKHDDLSISYMKRY